MTYTSWGSPCGDREANKRRVESNTAKNYYETIAQKTGEISGYIVISFSLSGLLRGRSSHERINLWFTSGDSPGNPPKMLI